MIKHILILICLFNATTFAQFPPGSRQSALGYAFTSVADDQWAIYYNPAGLSNLKNFSAGIYYSPAPFGLNELANGSVVIANMFSFGGIGFSASTYGFELFRESKISLAYAKTFYSDFSFGLKVTYNSVSIKNYGNDYSIGIDFGVLSKLSESVQLGFSARNINRPTYGVKKEKLAQIFSGGISYKPAQNFLISAELEKEVRYPFNFKLGLEYLPVKFFALRAGYNTEPNNYFAGIGIFYSNFVFNYSFISNNYLGYTHSFGIDFNL
ncbi:MAG: hypothetical protein ACPL25_00165 [Ignavibacteria bacterium]